MSHAKSIAASFGLLATLALATAPAQATPFGPRQYLVASYNSGVVQVYDSSLNYVGDLDSSRAQATGLAMSFNGGRTLISDTYGSGSPGTDRAKLYDESGSVVGSISSNQIDTSRDVTFSIDGSRLYFSSDANSKAISEFSYNAGTGQYDFSRKLGGRAYEGIATVSNDTLWAGRADSSGIDVFDLGTGNLINTISFGGRAIAMEYSALTDTVLVSDWNSQVIDEFDLSGNIVRTFSAPDFMGALGVTRGANNDVVATSYNNSSIFEWSKDGTLLTSVRVNATGPMGIVYTDDPADVPEPASLGLFAFGLGGLGLIRRRRQRKSVA